MVDEVSYQHHLYKDLLVSNIRGMFTCHIITSEWNVYCKYKQIIGIQKLLHSLCPLLSVYLSNHLNLALFSLFFLHHSQFLILFLLNASLKAQNLNNTKSQKLLLKLLSLLSISSRVKINSLPHKLDFARKLFC